MAVQDLGFLEGTYECRANVMSKQNITMGEENEA